MLGRIILKLARGLGKYWKLLAIVLIGEFFYRAFVGAVIGGFVGLVISGIIYAITTSEVIFGLIVVGIVVGWLLGLIREILVGEAPWPWDV